MKMAHLLGHPECQLGPFSSMSATSSDAIPLSPLTLTFMTLTWTSSPRLICQVPMHDNWKDNIHANEKIPIRSCTLGSMFCSDFRGEEFLVQSQFYLIGEGSSFEVFGGTVVDLSMMKAIVIDGAGGPEVLKLKEVPDPKAGEGEVVIKIVATGINRADVMQRQGNYPPPAGASLIPGLECSGIIESVGHGVSQWKVGDEVCALMGGGAYAEKVNVPAVQVLPVPKGLKLRDAAAIPEVACTVWSTIFMTCHLKEGETLLIHGGGSGIGTFGIQIAKAKGAKVLVTAGSDDKLKKCLELGADVGINYKKEDFVERAKAETGGKGVDVILDIMGASYLPRNLKALAMDGRLFLIATQGGEIGEIDLTAVIYRRLTVTGAGLRGRLTEKKGEIVQEVVKNVWPEIEAGKLKVMIDNVFPLAEASKAHEILEASTHFGKILLTA